MAAEMRAIGLAFDYPMLYTCLLDALPPEYDVERRQLAGKADLGRVEIIRVINEQFTRDPTSQNVGAPNHALFGGNAEGHVGRGQRNGKNGAGGGHGCGRGGKEYLRSGNKMELHVQAERTTRNPLSRRNRNA